MSISTPPLHRESLSTGARLAQYHNDLANEVARFQADPAAAAARLQTEIFESRALQSEGLHKRNIRDARLTGGTTENSQQDLSTEYRLMSPRLHPDEEAQAVLGEVAARLRIEGKDPSQFFFQPTELDGEILVGNASHFDVQRGLSEVYTVAMHSTPGLENGLLLVTSQVQGEQADIEFRLRSAKGINLGHIQDGWQFHPSANR